MFGILFKIWYFIVIFPILIMIEGYKKLKKFMANHNYAPDWAYAWLVILIILLVIIFIIQYGL